MWVCTHTHLSGMCFTGQHTALVRGVSCSHLLFPVNAENNTIQKYPPSLLQHFIPQSKKQRQKYNGFYMRDCVLALLCKLQILLNHKYVSFADGIEVVNWLEFGSHISQGLNLPLVQPMVE